MSVNTFAAQSYQGKNGYLNEGISKIQFCKQEFPAIFSGGGCKSKSKYFKNGIEVHVYGKRIAIFKNVSRPITGGFNTSIKDVQDWGDGTFHAMASSWAEAEKIIGKLNQTSNNSQAKDTNAKTINFTIKDKKEQCEAIGFKPQTEKFADCVLRLVELDVKKQQSNMALSNNNSTNNAIAKQLEIQNKQLERQRYDEGTKFLFDLSRQLSQPKSSSWSTCSYIDLGGDMSKVKCR